MQNLFFWSIWYAICPYQINNHRRASKEIAKASMENASFNRFINRSNIAQKPCRFDEKYSSNYGFLPRLCRKILFSAKKLVSRSEALNFFTRQKLTRKFSVVVSAWRLKDCSNDIGGTILLSGTDQINPGWKIPFNKAVVKSFC